MVVGLISDTHGLVRPEVHDALAGVDAILHAGDVGKPQVLDDLARLGAVIHTVRGNVDEGLWAETLPERLDLELGDKRFVLTHDRADLDEADLDDADIAVVGHSHKPATERVGDTLVVNPGSAGPRRFSLPTCVAKLTLPSLEVELIHLLRR